MVPSKPEKDESRRSSILKLHKSRQPLQNINTNSSSNENSPATSKIKRRVSFAEKKHVKEFRHSTEQWNVWDNTYEEHDSTFKGSFATDQNTKVDSMENASRVTEKDNCMNIGIETSSSHINSSNLIDNQLCTSTIEVYEDDKANDLNFTNPVEHMEMFSQKFPREQTILLTTSKSVSNIITVHTEKDKENYASNICNEYYPEMHANNVNSELDRTCIEDVSMEFTTVIPASLIPVYHDVKDDRQENVQKNNITSYQDNFDTTCTMEITKAVPWRNKAETYISTSKQQEDIYERKDTNSSLTFTEKTKLLSKSMDITKTVSVPSCQEKMYDIEYTTKSLVSDCNNELVEIIQAIPVSVEPIRSDIEAFKKVPVIVQNCEDARFDAPNNSMMLPTNLQPTSTIVPKWSQYDNCSSLHIVPDNSTKLTSTVRSLMADTEAFNVNNDGNNDADINISMEMTAAIPSKIHEKNTTHSYNKSAIQENNLRKSWENTERTNKTEFFNDLPMEITKSVNLYERNILQFNSDIDIVTGRNLRKNWEINKNSDETELFSDAPMQMTRPINAALSASVYNKENLRGNELMLRDDRDTFSHNTSMEMTKAILSRNREEMLNSIILKKNECERKNMNNSITFNEKTELLHKSMDITKAVSSSLLHKKTCNVENTAELTEAVVSCIATTARTPRNLSRENSTESPLQTDSTVNNDEVINASMEITAAIQPTMHHVENITLNKMENLNVSKSNELQHPTINDVAEFRKNKIRENVATPEETVETTILLDTSSNRVLTNSFNQLLSADLINANRKRPTHENKNTSTKKFRNDSLVESQFSVCGNAHSSPAADDKNVNNECLTEDTTNLTRISALSCRSNGDDSLNRIDECNFLKKNLENSLEELQSINPPSFVYMCSEEENSLYEFLREDKLPTSITTDVVPINNKNNNSEKLEKTNIEHDETKNCHIKSVVTDTVKSNRTADCQAIEGIIIDDCRVVESNHYETGVQHLEKSVLSISKVSRRKTTLSITDDFIETNVTREEQVDEEEYIREKINDEVKLRNIEQKEQCSEVGEEEERCIDRLKEATIKDQMNQDEYCQEDSYGKKEYTREEINNEVEMQNIEQKEQCSKVGEEEECCIDRLKETEAIIKDQMNQDEYCQEDSGSKENPQDVEQKEDHEKRLDAEQSINRIEEEKTLVEQDLFLSLLQKLEAYAENDDCIWNVYYKNVNRRMIGFGFMANSLLIITFLSDSLNHSEETLIKEIKIISRVADSSGVLIKIVHDLILEKINVEMLTHSYKTYEDVLPMLDFVSQDVKFAMNFMFDLKRLDNLNLMEIARNKISFVSWSKHMDIILNIIVNVKRFDKLTPSDIDIHCLLGTIRETEVQKLIKNVKKDHKFLSRYMSDVKDYIDIMEEISMTHN